MEISPTAVGDQGLCPLDPHQPLEKAGPKLYVFIILANTTVLVSSSLPVQVDSPTIAPSGSDICTAA